jgi:hypothetical protein
LEENGDIYKKIIIDREANRKEFKPSKSILSCFEQDTGAAKFENFPKKNY